MTQIDTKINSISRLKIVKSLPHAAFLMKLARVYAAQGNHEKEAEAYGKIVEDYPLYGQSHNIDVQKLLDRANLQAGK